MSSTTRKFLTQYTDSFQIANGKAYQVQTIGTQTEYEDLHLNKLKRPRNIKISGKVVHLTRNNAHQFQGQRSKVKVTRRINAHTVNAQYLPNGKFKLGTQTKHEDLQDQRSTSQGHRYWPIRQERNILKTYVKPTCTITFQATKHHRPLAGIKLHCLVTEAQCVNNLPKVDI